MRDRAVSPEHLRSERSAVRNRPGRARDFWPSKAQNRPPELSRGAGGVCLSPLPLRPDTGRARSCLALRPQLDLRGRIRSLGAFCAKGVDRGREQADAAYRDRGAVLRGCACVRRDGRIGCAGGGSRGMPEDREERRRALHGQVHRQGLHGARHQTSRRRRQTNKWEWSPGVKPENAHVHGEDQSPWNWSALRARSTARRARRSANGPAPRPAASRSPSPPANSKGGGECHSAGQAASVIVTNQLAIEVRRSRGKRLRRRRTCRRRSLGRPRLRIGAERHLGRIRMREHRPDPDKGSVAGVFTPASVNVMTKKAEMEFNGVVGEDPANSANRTCRTKPRSAAARSNRRDRAS